MKNTTLNRMHCVIDLGSEGEINCRSQKNGNVCNLDSQQKAPPCPFVPLFAQPW